MPTFDPRNARILSPEAAVDALLSATRHQLTSPIGRQRSREVAEMMDREGVDAFVQRFKAMPPLQAITELVHATATEGLDCDYHDPRPQAMELLSSARGEALMTLANENQLSRMDRSDAELLSCELEYALSDAQRRGCERDALIYKALMDALDDPNLGPEVFGQRHEGQVFTRYFEPSASEMPTFTDELNTGWAKVATSSDGVEAMYVRRDEFEAGHDAQAVRLVSAPGAALLGMPMLTRFGTGAHVTLEDLAENGITPRVLDVISPIYGNGDHLAATVASLTKEMDFEPTPEAAHVLPSCLREVIEKHCAPATPGATRAQSGPSMGM